MSCNAISKMMLQKFFVGELATDDATMVQRHLPLCDRCTAALATMQQEKELFVIQHPFRELEKKLPFKRSFIEMLFFQKSRSALVPAFAVLLLVVTAGPYLLNRSIQNSSQTIRTKGAESLTFIYKRDGAISVGKQGDQLKPGDEIQLQFTSSKDQYLTLFSVDTKGTLSFYGVDSGSSYSSVPAKLGAGHYYPFGIVLDETPGFELFVAVFSSKPQKQTDIEKLVGTIDNTKQYQELRDTIERRFKEEALNVATLYIKKN